MDISKIKEQVEFYFSDSNYAKDKFLNEEANKNNNCIPISTILSFNRMKDLNATVESVKEAVKDSTLVEVVEDSLRKVETKEYLEYCKNNQIYKRVVYMEGFNTDKTLDDIKEILNEYCKPVRIIMRRNQDKTFNGTCFVEFATEEEAKTILDKKIQIENLKTDDDVSKRVKTEPKYLTIISKEEYSVEKKKKENAEKDENFIKKVKKDFIPKLYKYECDESLGFADIKKTVNNVAYVDKNAKIIRMKFSQEWDEKEFEADGKNIKLTKLSEEEAQEYVSKLNIKKVTKKLTK